jgi:diaminohydroxyphosphoribosylaminopyrimidine deaminase/5-amino-6-(5-phosphoribosylamino)uracil reductase
MKANFPSNVSVVEPGPDRAMTWTMMLQRLASEGMYHLLIEGGGETNASALAAGIVDKVEFILAPKLIGGEAKGVVGGIGFEPALPLKEMQGVLVGNDFWVEAYLK